MADTQVRVYVIRRTVRQLKLAQAAFLRSLRPTGSRPKSRVFSNTLFKRRNLRCGKSSKVAF
eukprot:2368336-Pleurochrysis_carterae.AAC.1